MSAFNQILFDTCTVHVAVMLTRHVIT